MTNKKQGFEVYAHRVDENGEGTLIIRLKLGRGVSQQALRHIELEARDALSEALRPLKETIDEIVAKDRMVSNPEEENC